MFTTSDIKALHRLCLNDPSLPTPPRSVELTSGNGIITESKAKQEIEQLVTSGGMTRTSIFEIATKLSLEPHTVERFLPLQRDDWGRVGASVIVKTKEFTGLQKQLQEELQTRVVDTAEFCAECQIDMPLFFRLLPAKKGSWEWLGERKATVYSIEFWQEMRAKLQKELKESEFPVEPRKLLEGSGTIPGGFVAKVVADLVKRGEIEGLVEGSIFVPRAYVEKRQQALVQELRDEGVVAFFALSSERVEDPIAFVKGIVPGALILEQHAVTPGFYGELKGVVLQNIKKQDWSDIKDPEKRLSTEDAQLLRNMICKQNVGLENIAGYIVHQDLAGKLEEEQCKVLCRKRADLFWGSRSNGRMKGTPFRVQDVLSHLAKQTTLPTSLVSHYSTQLLPRCLEIYDGCIKLLWESELAATRTEFVNKFCLRFMLYRDGVAAVGDKSLRGKLALSLLAFAKENGVPALQKLEAGMSDDMNFSSEYIDALIRLLGEETPEDAKAVQKGLEKIGSGVEAVLQSIKCSAPSSDDLAKKKQVMMDDMLSQLEGSEDISLQMLLVLVLRHGASNDGLLWASGKHVPKLLKVLESSGIFTKGESALLGKTKLAATGKGSFSEDDVQALKGLGDRT